jgi:L-lactate dehydrogenase complex protein LldG
MSTDLVARFVDAASEAVDDCVRTDPEGFAGTISELVVEPAVGAPLPIPSVSLQETVVDTEPSVDALDAAKTGVTAAGTGIAAHGTITVESRPAGDELVSLYPPRHVVALDAEDIVSDLSAAFERFETAVRDARADGGPGASRVLATGPSATADMGGLVEGVHGPTNVHVVVVER